MKKGRPQLKKQIIIDAALKIFIKKGINNTKILDIAKMAKVNHTLVLYYFPTIDDIYEEVVNIILQELRTVTVAGLSLSNFEDKLTGYIEAPFIWSKSNPEKAKIWVYFYYTSTFYPRMKTFNSEIRTIGRERIKQLIFEGIAQNYFKKMTNEEIERYCFNIQGLITGNAIMALTEKNITIDRAADLTVKSIQEMLY